MKLYKLTTICALLCLNGLGLATASSPTTVTGTTSTTSPVAPVISTTASVAGTTASVAGTTAPVAGTTTPVASVAGTTTPVASVAGTTALVAGTTTPVASVAGTTALVAGTTAPVASVAGTATPVAPVISTTASVAGTTAPVAGTTVSAPSTTASVAGTTASVAGTTALVAGTTALVAGTTASVAGTTASVAGTTVSAPSTTVSVNNTTAAVASSSALATTNATDNATTTVSSGDNSTITALMDATTNTTEASTSSSASDLTTAATTEIVTVCGKTIEVNSSSPCHPSMHTTLVQDLKNPSLSECDESIEANQWVLFKNKEDKCLYIPSVKTGECFKPDSCGTQYPYYISPHNKTTQKLCHTDSTKSNDILCCQDEQPIEIEECDGSYSVYQLSKQIIQDDCAKICLSTTEDVPPFSFIVDNNDAEQKKFEDLTEKEKPHLVTVIFTITDRKKLEKAWKYFPAQFNMQLDTALKAGSRRRRAVSDGNYTLYILDGYPKVGENEMTVVLFVEDDSGQVIPKAKVEKAMANLADPRIISNSGVTYVRTEELPKELQPSSNTGKGEAKQGSEKVDNRLWIAIVIIVGLTAGIVAITFMGVWCYNFTKKKKTGQMHISQKNGLVGADELNNSYKPISGHDNLAMEGDNDPNHNAARGKIVEDEMNNVAENAV